MVSTHIYPRLLAPPKGSFFLFGPRGTGKTTWPRGPRFVLCASGPRRLKTAGTNLLAGGAVRRNMHSLLPKELGRDFDIESILRWGSLPVVWSAPDRGEALPAHAHLH